ncbi:hypothetical protein [Candidatus Phytoplasma pruni]|uniref:Uncharacterized protein n=1 Tax=Candidatus Phytoplasma pruni TaxID=479893 RepID=A0A851HA95_9MOLU|nr:hypothetical protein [Candidatus Phytoplasma pruni]NWN45817.1 hypothetical protein [Candidatus Phytoplasma pruni]
MAIEFPSENVVQIHHFFKDQNGNQKYETYTRNIEESRGKARILNVFYVKKNKND